MENKICPRCYYSNKPDAVNCWKCGYALSLVDEAEEAEEKHQPHPPYQPRKPVKSQKRTLNKLNIDLDWPILTWSPWKLTLLVVLLVLLGTCLLASFGYLK
jgi:hypothetical protein